MKEYMIAVISGSMVLLGVAISQLTTYVLARQRATQERFQFERQRLKESEQRRLEKIEMMYGYSVDIAVLTGEFRNILISKPNQAVIDAFLKDFNTIFRAFIVNLDLYFPELRPQSSRISTAYTELLVVVFISGACRSEHYQEDISVQWDGSAAIILSALQEIQASLRNIIRKESLAILSPIYQKSARENQGNRPPKANTPT